MNHRKLRPRRWTWSMHWFAPVSRSSGGRSAVRRISGTQSCIASTTACERGAVCAWDDRGVRERARVGGGAM